MIQYTNSRFIIAERLSLKLPDNVFLDFNPPVVPVEGFVCCSPDLLTTIDVNLVESVQDARAFLLEALENAEAVQVLREPQHVSTSPLEGYSMAYASENYSYEEYVFAVPGTEPALFDVCFTRRLAELPDAEIYTKLRDELLAGIEACYT